ncbi:hypothetical protein [Clostridium sp. CTA-5]
MKNKDFIPRKFYGEKSKQEQNDKRRIKTLFIILNILILPITLKNLQEFKNASVDNIEIIEETNVLEEELDIKTIECWVENTLIDEVEWARITKDGGEIEVNNLELLNNEKLKENINIKCLNSNNNGNYILGVDLIEKR